MYPELRRKDLGICGTLIILFQCLVSFQSHQSVSEKLESLEDDLRDSKTHVEEFFVRKTEMENMSNKLEKVNEQLGSINVKVVSLRAFLKDQFKYDGDDLSCKNNDLKVAVTAEKGSFDGRRHRD